MSDSNTGHRSKLITADTKVTLPFVLLAILLWLGVRSVTDQFIIQVGVLIGIGVIAPIIINEIR